MRLIRSAALVAVVFVFVSISHGGPAAAAADSAVLRWTELETLIAAHPQLQVAKSQIGIAAGEAGLARQYPNPELALKLGQSKEKKGSAKSFIWESELTIPIEWPGTRIARSRAARIGLRAAGEEAQTLRLEVYRELRGLYLSIAYDQELQRLSDASAAELEAMVRLVALRVEKGDARPLELARAESERLEWRLEKERAQRLAETHRAQLNLWLGGRLPAAFTVDADWETLPELPALPETLARAATHPALKAALARREQARAAISAQQHAAVPSLGLGAFIGEEADSRNYGGLLSLSLPVWNWNLGAIATARAQEKLAAANSELATKRTQEAVIAAHSRAAATRQALAQYAAELLPMAEKALAAAEKLYQAGEVGWVEVLDARRALIRARNGQQATRYDYFSALLELTLLCGETPHA